MGCCFSCNEESSSQNGDTNESSRLLGDSTHHTSIQIAHNDDYESQYPNSLTSKTDEQSALNRILQETATNVIDVAAMGTHNLEQHEYLERVKHYSLKLQGVAIRHPISRKPTCLLQDIPAPDKLLGVTPIREADFYQVMSTCAAATAALSELKVDHKEDLVVPFRIP